MEHCEKAHLSAHNNNFLIGFSSISFLSPPTPFLRNFAPEKRIHFYQFRSKFNMFGFFFWGGRGREGCSSLVFMIFITRKAATLVTSIVDLKQWRIMFGAVTKRRGPGISAGYSQRKIKQNKTQQKPLAV